MADPSPLAAALPPSPATTAWWPVLLALAPALGAGYGADAAVQRTAVTPAAVSAAVEVGLVPMRRELAGIARDVDELRRARRGRREGDHGSL